MNYASIPHAEGEFILRSLQKSDIPAYVDYWFGPKGASVRQAMDPSLLGTPELMRQRLEKRLENPSDQPSFLLVVEHQGETLG